MTRNEVLFSGDWIEVILRDGWYEFARYKTSNGGVYILPYRRGFEKSVLGRFEITPAHKDKKPELTIITGGINENESPIDIAILEMYEEAGYRVGPGDFRSLGKVFLAKGADFVGHLYIIDVTDMERSHAPGDGSKGEQGAYCDWVTPAMMAYCKDPVASTIMLRAKLSDLVELI